MPLAKGMGLSHDKTNDFLIIKNKLAQIRDPGLRFKPQTNVIAQFGNLTSQETSKQALPTRSSSQASSQNNSGKLKPGQYKKMVDEEVFNKHVLPPVWVDVQEGIDDKIKDLDDHFQKLIALRGQRLKPKFNEEEDQKLDFEINSHVETLTLEMMKDASIEDKDYQIRKNIQQTYLLKLQDLTKQLRQIEREHLLKVKNLYGEEGEIFLDKIENDPHSIFDGDLQKRDQRSQDLIQLEHNEEQQNQRQEGIDRIVKQIHELAELFKDLSTLVVEQGTVLDRIDYNVQEARVNVQKGNKELVKTYKRETSFRAKSCITCQVATIFICLVLLMIKHT